MTFRAFSIGFGAAVLALACGSDDNNTDTDTETTPVTQQPPVVPTDVGPAEETCDQNPLLAQCRPAVTPANPGNTPADPNESEEARLARAAAENVLQANCGQCHGGQLTPQTAQAGMNYIDDIDQLVSTGKIVPLNSAGSRLVQRMVRREMPPISSGLPEVTEADINTVSQYIDNPRFWPEVQATGVNCTDDEQLVDYDQLFQDVNDDLSGEDADDTQFYRYVSLTNRFTAGVCADALDKDRQGLTKMLNMLSINASIEEALPINNDETLFRIDLRDFDWNRAISVDGANFNDVWEAIAANNPYAVEFIGDDADDAKADTVTAFPIMFADQMMDVAIIGNLYYAIIDVDVAQPLATFITDLGIDVNQNILDGDSIRAGTTKSRISRQDRLVQRDDIEIRGGALWQSFDFEDDANESIFEDPFGFAAGGTEAIFTLPNGMLGFIIADENDAIVEDSDILLDTNQNNFRAITSVSCSNCHAAGFIPVVDEVAEISTRNAREIGLDRDEIEQLEELYITPQAFARQVQEDSQGFYQTALQRANLPTAGGDPVSSVFLRFDADMRLADAAGDLGILPEELQDNLQLLDPVVSVLDTGTLDRDDFTNVFVDSLCQLSDVLENQPDPVVCDAAAAALLQ